MGRLTQEQLAVFVAESCERQGVPIKVTDVRVLANVATLLRGDRQIAMRGGLTSVVVDDETGEVVTELRETDS